MPKKKKKDKPCRVHHLHSQEGHSEALIWTYIIRNWLNYEVEGAVLQKANFAQDFWHQVHIWGFQNHTWVL